MIEFMTETHSDPLEPAAEALRRVFCETNTSPDTAYAPWSMLDSGSRLSWLAVARAAKERFGEYQDALAAQIDQFSSVVRESVTVVQWENIRLKLAGCEDTPVRVHVDRIIADKDGVNVEGTVVRESSAFLSFTDQLVQISEEIDMLGEQIRQGRATLVAQRAQVEVLKGQLGDLSLRVMTERNEVNRSPGVGRYDD